MDKKIFAVNTARVAVDDVIHYVSELDPTIKMHSIVDDSLAAEIIENN